MLKLIIEDDEGRKTVVPFVREEITIGRQEGCTIRLTERNVSRRHARLVRSNGSVLVEDLGSYNGIRINGQRISGQVNIADGDLIQIGDYDLAIQHERTATAPPPIPPVAPLGETSTPSNQRITLDLEAAAEPESASQTIDESAEPEEASSEDVQPAPQLEPEIARRHSTAVIRIKEEEPSEGADIELDAAEAPRLVVLNTELAGREFACIRTQLTLGRAEENHISLDHRSLSRTHVKLVRESDGEWRVLDQGSANGVLVNGEVYAQATLRSGDVLELGHVKLKFLGPGEEFKFVPGAHDGGRRGRSRPLRVLGFAVIAIGGAAGLYFALSPAASTPEPFETSVPAQAPSQREKNVAESLAAAKDALEHLQWARARRQLAPITANDGAPHAEATALLAEVDAEEAWQQNLEGAQKALAAGALPEARRLLDESASTRLQTQRRSELEAALTKASRQQDEPPPPPAVKKRPPPPAAPDTAEEAQKFYEEGVGLLKAKQVREAKTLFERCLKLDPKQPSCHMMLGTVFAKLGDPERGAHQYREFLRLAPNDKAADKVRAILETYDSMKK